MLIYIVIYSGYSLTAVGLVVSSSLSSTISQKRYCTALFCNLCLSELSQLHSTLHYVYTYVHIVPPFAQTQTHISLSQSQSQSQSYFRTGGLPQINSS
jgi:hypothetical protein